MIDMHSHILPNIDDGARNEEETNRLIIEAKNAGFEAIITTPHYMENYYEMDEIKRKKLINTIQTDIKLYVGNEIYLSENITKLIKENKASTINNTNYVLFEMPLNAQPMNIYDLIYEMLQYKLIPILAHPERYTYIQQNPQIVCELIQKGVLMQSNYGSIIGQYGKKAQALVKIFLRNNMIHFLGTDTHRPSTVYFNMEKILERLVKLIGKNKMDELSTVNPKLVLENKRIEIDIPNEIKLTLGDKLILKI